MAGEVNIRLEYSPEKDILSIIVLPEQRFFGHSLFDSLD